MRSSNFNWPAGLFIIVYHLILFIGLPLFFINHSVSWQMITVSSILMYGTGICVTTGYHRCYSHSAFKIHPAAEAVILFFATMGAQGSALRWSFEHRHHHAFVDTDRDPYSIKKGFMYAHLMWLFQKPKEIDPKVVSDLMRSPLLRFQERYYPYLLVLTNALCILCVGWIFNDYLAAFLFAFIARMFVLHHFTWFINSLAHTWGARRFCKELSAVDNYLIALVTFGEGYHNYHHTFAYDYRNGIRWYHFDPTKWLVWTLSKLGLASNLKTVPRYRIEEKLLKDRKELLMEKIQNSLCNQKEEWESKITLVIDNVLGTLKQIKDLSDQYQSLKKMPGSKEDLLRSMNIQIKELNKSLKEEYQQWIALYRSVTALPSSQT